MGETTSAADPVDIAASPAHMPTQLATTMLSFSDLTSAFPSSAIPFY
jgi:hypothetical protein